MVAGGPWSIIYINLEPDYSLVLKKKIKEKFLIECMVMCDGMWNGMKRIKDVTAPANIQLEE